MPAPKGNKFGLGGKGGGRKSDYDPRYVILAERACLMGLTDVELAAYLKVSESTITRWKLEHEAFANALKVGKAPADDRVERSLFLNAIGYVYKAVKPMVVDKSVRLVEYTERVNGNTAAQIFWLKNRRKDLWRDVQQHEHGGAGEFSKNSDEEIAAQMARAAQELAKLEGEEKKKTPPPAVKTNGKSANGRLN